MEFYKSEDTQYALDKVRSSQIVYASMEIALHPEMYTYTGGLGVLAGDTLRSCADMGVAVCGLTLLYREGYFKQNIVNTRQVEEIEPWDIDRFTTPLREGRVSIFIENREVIIEPRIGILVGYENHVVPVLFLDSHLEENDPLDRGITDRVYAGDQRMRIKQEAILGICGKRVLRSLQARSIHTFHMNEGHAALAPVEDARYLGKYYGFNTEKIRELVRSMHVFTTHTPVPAGHDRFSYDLVRQVLGDDCGWNYLALGGHDELNMTRLALNLSRFSNGVAQRHGEVSRKMFPGFDIAAITNGVHLPSWMNHHVIELLDRTLPSWRHEPGILTHAYRIVDPLELEKAHQNAKRDMISFVHKRTGKLLDESRLTIGFARRFASYKRADLIFSDIERFLQLTNGKVQFVFAGEAHPNDYEGKEILSRVIGLSESLDVPIAFVKDYNVVVTKQLVSGSDVWLNNPMPPKEASGTSGMKAAANAVPNLSTLDGWWIEGITTSPLAGWIIHHRHDGHDEISLYEQLEHIIRVYYDHPERWREHRLHALSLAAYFNTHRMVQEYEDQAWSLKLH